MPNVLIIDDEKNILTAIERLLKKEDFSVFTGEIGSEGIKLLNEHEFDVIISDMRMPEMNGVQFLSEAIKIQPQAIRIILSGYAEKESVIEAINTGNIWNYITKPWDNEQLCITIRSAIEIYQAKQTQLNLLKELEIKNNELEALNHSLEVKVKERTQELNEKVQFLEELLETDDYDFIIEKIKTSMISHNEIVDVNVIEGDQANSSGLKILKNNQCLGYLQVIQANETVKIEKISNKYLSLLGVTLTMKNLSLNGDELKDQIDDMILSMESFYDN